MVQESGGVYQGRKDLGGSQQAVSAVITSFLRKDKGCQEEEKFICFLWPGLVVTSVEVLVTFQEKRSGPRFLSIETENKMYNSSRSPMGSTIYMLLSQVPETTASSKAKEPPFLGS